MLTAMGLRQPKWSDLFTNVDHVALVFDGDGDLIERFLHGPAIDQVLAQEDSAGQVLWPLGDNLGSVRDIVDSSGTVVTHITYDAYGQVTSESNPQINFRFGYTGRERDGESGLYYYRDRYYDAAVGQFLSEDPIGFLGNDVNVRRYVGGSPVDQVDPFGQAGWVADASHYTASPSDLLPSMPSRDRLASFAYKVGAGVAVGAAVAAIATPIVILGGGMAFGLLSAAVGAPAAASITFWGGFLGGHALTGMYLVNEAKRVNQMDLDGFGKFEEMWAHMIGQTIGGAIAARAICKSTAFMKEYRSKIKDKLLNRYPTAGAGAEREKIIQDYVRRKNLDMGIRANDPLTAANVRKGAKLGFSGKPMEEKAKTFWGWINKGNGQYMVGDLDISFMKQNGRFLNNNQVIEHAMALNRELRKAGFGDAFMHGSHFTALKKWGGGPASNIFDYRKWAPVGGGPSHIYSAAGVSVKSTQQMAFLDAQHKNALYWSGFDQIGGGKAATGQWRPLRLQAELGRSLTVHESLSVEVAELMTQAALEFWEVAAPGALPFEVTVAVQDLPDLELGHSSLMQVGDQADVQAAIVVDDDAAGVGWYVDATPFDHQEFAAAVSDTAWKATGDSPANGRYDLLTTVLHELGHAIDLYADHSAGIPVHAHHDEYHLTGDDNRFDLMHDVLQPSIRKLPSIADLQLLEQPLPVTADHDDHAGPLVGPLVHDDWRPEQSLIAPQTVEKRVPAADPGDFWLEPIELSDVPFEPQLVWNLERGDDSGDDDIDLNRQLDEELVELLANSATENKTIPGEDSAE